jgi:hypothetical protein
MLEDLRGCLGSEGFLIGEKNMQREVRNSEVRNKKTRSKKASLTRSRRPQKNIQELIKKRAYEIWEQKGYPENTDTENWIEAERELTRV